MSRRADTQTRLTPSQKRAFDLFKEGRNLLITGKGGTGKSFLLREIRNYLESQHRNILVCASTGIAALNVGGATIHRTFRCPVRIVMPDEEFKPRHEPEGDETQRRKAMDQDPDPYEVILNADVVIIDEISMCRMDVFGYVARTILHCKRPKQVILVGDFYQLPPVLTDHNKEKEAWNQIPEYTARIFAFESEEWKRLGITTIELQENMRQKDEDYIKALDDIREGKPNFGVFRFNQKPDPDAVTLCPTNDKAAEINREALRKLIRKGNKSVTFMEELEGSVVSTSDKVLEKYRVTSKELTLCVDARVIILVNAKKGEYVNGDTGTVTGIAEESVSIRLDSGRGITLGRKKWDIEEYQIVEEEDGRTGKKTKKPRLVTIGSISQIPVKLAWAISVHKSQGQTYDRCNVVCRFWTEGQMYVALSRCRTLAGLRLLGTLEAKELLYSEEVNAFMREAVAVNTVTEIRISAKSHEKTARNPKGAGRRIREDQTTVRKHVMRLTSQEKSIIEKLRASEAFRKKIFSI